VKNKAFVQGKEAFKENKGMTSNPYKKHTSDFEVWLAGYLFAQSFLRNK